MFLFLSPLVRYGVAVLAVVLSLIYTQWFASLYQQGIVFVMLGGVMLAAWLGGRGPGWLATLLSTIGSMYFIVPPVSSFSMRGPADEIRMMLFVGVCGLIVVLTDRQHRANANLLKSNETLEREVLKRKQVEAALRAQGFLLEQLVNERTAELRETNQKLQDEIAHRTTVEDALRQSNEHLEIQVRERTRELSDANEVLQEKNEDLEKFYDLVVGRELNLMAAEKEVERLQVLLQQHGPSPTKSDSAFNDTIPATSTRPSKPAIS
jgi:K+-sensing histidine kinase KdpD